MWTALVGLEFPPETSAGSGDDARAAEIGVRRSAPRPTLVRWWTHRQEGAPSELVEGRSPDAF